MLGQVKKLNRGGGAEGGAECSFYTKLFGIEQLFWVERIRLSGGGAPPLGGRWGASCFAWKIQNAP